MLVETRTYEISPFSTVVPMGVGLGLKHPPWKVFSSVRSGMLAGLFKFD
jgi:hypothetical protein